MSKPLKKRIWKWVKVLLIVYVVAGLLLYFFQDHILFLPQRLPIDHVFNFSGNFKEVNVPVNNETNLNIVQFTVPDSACKGIVLYFHGNRRNIERYAPYASNFTHNNYEVWMIDYPGFGKSTGERSEKILYDDALLFYKMARARFGSDSIIIYGRSLGTGIASHLASVRDCKRLILEAPYYSIDALFRHYAFFYPASWITKYHLPTFQYLPNVNAPISLFHGTDDEVIPYSQSKRLLKIAGEKTTLYSIENGKHNTLNDFPLFHRTLDSLLQH